MSNGAVVFHKTAKGVEEMEKRCHGLSPKVRRVLIMIDGKRSVDVLREMALADDLTHTIGALEEEGFIEVMGIAGAGTGRASAVNHGLQGRAAARRSDASATVAQFHGQHDQCVFRLARQFVPARAP